MEVKRMSNLPTTYPDGITVGGRHYPFTVDGERNPALEWRWLCEHDMYQYTETEAADIAHDCQGEMHPWMDSGCRWVAVGVKEVSE